MGSMAAVKSAMGDFAACDGTGRMQWRACVVAMANVAAYMWLMDLFPLYLCCEDFFNLDNNGKKITQTILIRVYFFTQTILIFGVFV